ncbi:MAG: lysophospholipid acyltransferase family protein [Bdellovibrionota bacterium]|nr:lipid A biosynthesis lauroyl acyltransferase [Pseudobdellovibrionaceae bacterium]|tara:strand:+ start:18448 stop:19323 length:876 start_codon:yes stop_codon:yes gene_type:complete
MKSLGLFFLKSISYLIYLMSRKLRLALGSFFGILWFDILRLRRDVLDENIQIAFPEMPYPERKRIARESCKGMGKALIEYFLFPHVNADNIDDYFVCKNWHVYEDLKKQNKGVLVLSLHLGSYDFLSVFLALKGMDLHLISKEMKVQWLNDLWFGLRKSKGLKYISDRKAKFDIIKALKKKAAVAFIIDQFTGPPIGIESTFFGKKTGSARGLALFHAWTKAPVLPIYNFRRDDGKIEVVFGEPVSLEEAEDRDQTVALMTQKYNTVLENIIREHPEQWLWVHRRWKEFKY